MISAVERGASDAQVGAGVPTAVGGGRGPGGGGLRRPPHDHT